MILENYNGFVNYEKLCEMTKTNKNGTTAYNIVETLKKLGFNSYGIHYELNKQADKLILPAIAHVVINNSYNHFIVIYEINYNKEYLLIADPAQKVKKISFMDFNKIFSNIILIAYPIQKIVKEKEITIKDYLTSVAFNKKYIVIFILTLISLICSFIYLILIKYFLNGTFKINLLISIIIIIFIKYILNLIKNKKIIYEKNKKYKKLMTESFLDILNLPYKYYRNHTTGDVISRINDIDKIKDLLDIFIILFTDIILIILSSFLLISINKILFLTVLIILCLYLFNYLYYHKKVQLKLEDIKISKSLINSYMTESIMAYESIKGQNLESYIKDQFENKNSNYINSLKQYENLTNKMSLINDFIFDISILIILSIGLLFINKNIMTYGDLIIFYTVMNYFLEPVKNFNEMNLIIQEIKISFKRIFNLKYFQNKIKRKKLYSDINIKALNYDIEDRKIIKNLNLQLKQKEKIMITGKSGCGKSTLLKLIKQFYSTNDIYIDNININKIDMNKNITYISQNEYLFTDTLYNNIVMNNKISSNELQKIIKICELDDIVSNKMGLNMLIEENGFNLSGGERQRIILARALVNIKDYLFIDEGLSEVNVDMERRILKKLFSTYKSKTIIVVSHRLDNLDLFDKLVKLDKKEIIERR